jgi:hypothetical protein
MSPVQKCIAVFLNYSLKNRRIPRQAGTFIHRADERSRRSAAILSYQEQISDCVCERPDLTILAFVDRPYTDKAEPEPVARSQDDALAFELEPVTGRHQRWERLFSYKSESALAIRNRHVAQPPNLP